MDPCEDRLLPADLLAAREAWLTGSTIEILAIRSVDGHPIGAACPGPATHELQRRYRERVAAFCRDPGAR
jgi:branched-subunit amino acid aminotransferase/4-amino-4-deoxychorismate lyase